MSIKTPPKDRSGKTAEEFRKIGAYVIRSDESRERIDKIRDKICQKLEETIIAETPQKTLENLGKKWMEIVGVIRHVGIPYLRGGTDPNTARLVFLFEKMDGMAKSFVSVMTDLVKSYVEAETIKIKKGMLTEYVTSWDTTRKIIRFMYKEFFPRALGIAGISWRHEDLTEKEVISIQQAIVSVSQREDISRDDLFGIR